jgi:hypothetical protein
MAARVGRSSASVGTSLDPGHPSASGTSQASSRGARKMPAKAPATIVSVTASRGRTQERSYVLTAGLTKPGGGWTFGR